MATIRTFDPDEDYATAHSPIVTGVPSKQTLYRIYTEDFPSVYGIAAVYFDSFTIYRHLEGRYDGRAERSTVIEVISGDPFEMSRKIKTFIQALKDENYQQEVLVTKQEVDCEVL